MTSHVGRLYAAALAILVFFVLWAAIAARPWKTTTTVDPRLQQLALRRQALRRETTLVNQVLALRAQAKANATAATAAAATPAVRVVTLPPLTITRTS